MNLHKAYKQKTFDTLMIVRVKCPNNQRRLREQTKPLFLEEIIKQVERYQKCIAVHMRLRVQGKPFFLEEMKKTVEQYQKCIAVQRHSQKLTYASRIYQ